jgi:Beta-propeller repeat
VSKLSGKLMPAVGVIAVAVVALAAVVGAGHLRTHAKATSLAATPTTQAPALSIQQRARFHAQLEALPLAFEANQGQLDPQVKYMARGDGYTVFLTPKDTVFAVRSSSHAAPAPAQGKFAGSARKTVRGADQQTTSAVFMKLVGANPQPQIVAGRELPGYTNYYIGNDRSKWQTGVKQYAGVSYRDIYPGVDMAFHGQQRQLEFDFIVAPGAKSDSIAMGFSGEKKLATDNSGNLILSAGAGDVVLHKPVAYQERNGKRELVDVGFQVKSRHEVAFALGAYDHSRELVIDPSLSYAMFLGGSGEDEAFSIAVDGSGNAYVAGQTASPNFPAHAGTVSTSGGFDAFVTRIGSGTAPDFTTLIGGTGTETALGVAVNSTGVYVVGNTSSTTFASITNIGPRGAQDVFVAKLNSATGIASYITRIGGTGTDSGNGIAVDASGNAYIGGETTSSDFPTVTPVQSTNNSGDTGWVAKLNAGGTALTYSTYLGGSTGDLVTGIALDSSNNAYVTGITVSSDFPTTTGAFQTTINGTSGDDAFVTEVKSDGSALVYSTFLGGSGSDDALGIAVDAAGEAYVTGDTNSTDFPTANAAQASDGGGKDVFVTKLTSDGSGLLFSTYYGGTLDETGTGIALDSFGDAYITGRTASSGFAVPGSPFQASLSGTSDAFVLELSNTGFAVYASFLGGTGNENSIAANTTLGAVGAVAVDSSSNAYLAGATNSGNFPIASAFTCCGAIGGGLADGFVAKVGSAPADFSVAASPATISTTSGTTTAAITVTVSSVNASYGQAVALTCGSLPSKAVCHFSPASVTPGAAAVTSSLTIATNGAASASSLAPFSRQTQFFAALLMPFVGLVVVGASMSSQRKRFFGLALLALVLVSLLMLPACGGGSGGGGGGGGGNNTPPGNYNIMVTGSAGGATHSAAVALTVN